MEIHLIFNGKIHENPLFLWPFSIAMLVITNSPFLVGKSTISMAIFHGKMLVHQRVPVGCPEKHQAH